MGVIYSLFASIYGYIHKMMFSSIHIKSGDDTFLWVSKYLVDKNLVSKGSSANLRARIKRGGHWWEEIDMVRDDAKIPDLTYSAGGGIHQFEYKGRSLWVHHCVGKTVLTGWDKTPTEQEDLYIKCWGNDTTILKEFITDAITHCVSNDSGRTGIYEQGWCETWNKVQSKKCRTMDSVILDDGIAKDVIADIKNFEASEDWYKSKGIPWRRGYLLYGPPGTGKTSLTQAISGALGYSICYVNLSSDRLNDD